MVIGQLRRLRQCVIFSSAWRTAASLTLVGLVDIPVGLDCMRLLQIVGKNWRVSRSDAYASCGARLSW
jgi:hypothetical protein